MTWNKHNVIHALTVVVLIYDYRVNYKTRKVAMDLYDENVEMREKISQKDKELRFMSEQLKKAGVTPDANYAVR
jgi:hypothetical protein